MTASAAELALYDPKKLIRQIVELDEPVAAHPRECVLLWLMSLPEQVDPAEAARCLLRDVVTAEAVKGELAADLRKELGEVARYPSAHLSPANRRRGRVSRG